MNIQQMIQSFQAFNLNSIHNLVYVFQTNLWLILSVVGSLGIIVLNVKEEIEDYVTEEQNII